MFDPQQGEGGCRSTVLAILLFILALVVLGMIEMSSRTEAQPPPPITIVHMPVAQRTEEPTMPPPPLETAPSKLVYIPEVATQLVLQPHNPRMWAVLHARMTQRPDLVWHPTATPITPTATIIPPETRVPPTPRPTPTNNVEIGKRANEATWTAEARSFVKTPIATNAPLIVGAPLRPVRVIKAPDDFVPEPTPTDNVIAWQVRIDGTTVPVMTPPPPPTLDPSIPRTPFLADQYYPLDPEQIGAPGTIRTGLDPGFVSPHNPLGLYTCATESRTTYCWNKIGCSLDSQLYLEHSLPEKCDCDSPELQECLEESDTSLGPWIATAEFLLTQDAIAAPTQTKQAQDAATAAAMLAQGAERYNELATQQAQRCKNHEISGSSTKCFLYPTLTPRARSNKKKVVNRPTSTPRAGAVGPPPVESSLRQQALNQCFSGGAGLSNRIRQGESNGEDTHHLKEQFSNIYGSACCTVRDTFVCVH